MEPLESPRGPEAYRGPPISTPIVVSSFQLPLSPLRAGRSLHIIGGRGWDLHASQPNMQASQASYCTILCRRLNWTADALSFSLRSPSPLPGKNIPSLANYHASLLVFSFFSQLLFSGALLSLSHTTHTTRSYTRYYFHPTYDPPPNTP